MKTYKFGFEIAVNGGGFLTNEVIDVIGGEAFVGLVLQCFSVAAFINVDMANGSASDNGAVGF